MMRNPIVLPRALRFIACLQNRTAWIVSVAIGAAAIRLFFWAYTGSLWEDALITVLHSENAVSGLGLTHFKIDDPPVHGFTSPLSVLVRSSAMPYRSDSDSL